MSEARAALYARVSTDDRGQDPELQLEDLRLLARARGWEVVDEYVDRQSAAADRKEFRRMMEDARAGRVRVVAVWRFDRFARSTTQLLAAMDEFRTLGVDFVSVREAVDTSTPAGKLMFTLIAAMAEFERDLIRERVTAGVRRAQRAGKHCGRPRARPGLTGEAARAAIALHGGLKPAARKLKISVTVLRRRSKEV